MDEIRLLREFLAETGMTQAELAERLGYHYVYIRKVLNGLAPITDALRYRALVTLDLDLRNVHAECAQ